MAPSVAGIEEHAVQLTSSVAADLTNGLDSLDLTSISSPIGEWINVFSGAVTNIEGISNEILADPLPILHQVLTNQLGFANTLDTNLQTIAGTVQTLLQALPADLQTLFSSIASGDISNAVANFNTDLLLSLLPTVQPLEAILGIPGEISQNLTNAIDTLPTIAINSILGLVDVQFTTTQALADSAYDAIGAGQPLTAFTDLLNTPAIVTGAFLNGYTSPVIGAFSPGVLTPEQIPGFTFTGGPLDTLLVGIPQTIAPALGASSSSDPAAALDPASMMADLGSVLNPSALLGDLGNLFDPSAVTDIGSLLSADLGPNLVLDLLTSL